MKEKYFSASTVGAEVTKNGSITLVKGGSTIHLTLEQASELLGPLCQAISHVCAENSKALQKAPDAIKGVKDAQKAQKEIVDRFAAILDEE